MVDSPDLTQLLLDWGEGDSRALDRLLPHVYDQLRIMARRFFLREAPGHTLQPTALVNEAYLRLVDQRRVRWHNRAQFFAVAARIMRRILVDHARKSRAAKRSPVVLDAGSSWGGGAGVDPLALDEALGALAEFAPRQAQIVELRFFGGLTIEETAEVLEMSPRTVKQDWSMARAWLFGELSKG